MSVGALGVFVETDEFGGGPCCLGDRPRLLVREQGVNTYATSQAFDIQVAEQYWKETHVYWDEVRAV